MYGVVSYGLQHMLYVCVLYMCVALVSDERGEGERWRDEMTKKRRMAQCT